MRVAGRAGWVAAGLVATAMAVAVTGCGGGSGGSGGSANRSGDQAEAAADEHREPEGAQRSTSPSGSPRSAPPTDGRGDPRVPLPKMTAVSHVMTGGVRGIAKLTVDASGRWTRSAAGSGKLTASQIATLNRLLTSDSLAQEAKRYAAANRPKAPTSCGQDLAQTLKTATVTLRKSTCDSNHIATPTHDQVVKLLYEYTHG